MKNFLLLSGIIILLLALFQIGGCLNRTEKMKRMDSSYCPEENNIQKERGIVVRGHTAIIIDTSNRIPAKDADRAFQEIGALVSDTARWLDRLSLYGLPSSRNESFPADPPSFCIPKTGELANIIYENPERVRRNFSRFLDRLQDSLEVLVDRKEANQSPLVESLANLVEQDLKLNSAILVSDMLQNTPLWRSYSNEGDTKGVESECQRITEPGRLNSIFVYYIDRGLENVQASRWPDGFWTACLGGVAVSMLN